jgi:metal-responsive CopG/Arc/MetJ family transcriptional regulator
MKITIELPDSLWREFREVAAQEGIILRALFARALRRVIHDSKHQPRFKLRRATFKGKDLRPRVPGRFVGEDP